VHPTSAVWTIGHSTHDLSTFVHLLAEAGIGAVADVRSRPFSRFNPQFNRDPLRAALLETGTEYAFLGDELGGRPATPELYDQDGHVRYGALAKTGRFGRGLQRLLEGCARFRVAVMCSEEDPTHCHRRLLLARVLAGHDVDVNHIRGDGTLVSEAELAAVARREAHPALFSEEDEPWRSTRSVLRSAAPRASSRI
jgi:uncharacterized protein (DUF488 family)